LSVSSACDCFLPGVGQRVSREDPLLNGMTIDEGFLHEARDALGGHAAVPRPFRIHDEDGSARADTQALHLRSVAGARTRTERQVALLQFRLQLLPRLAAGFRGAAGIADAQEDVTVVMADQELVGDRREVGVWFGHQRPRFRAIARRTRRAISAKTSTLDVATGITSQSITVSGSTLKTLPPRVTINTWPTTVRDAITRN